MAHVSTIDITLLDVAPKPLQGYYPIEPKSMIAYVRSYSLQFLVNLTYGLYISYRIVGRTAEYIHFQQAFVCTKQPKMTSAVRKTAQALWKCALSCNVHSLT